MKTFLTLILLAAALCARAQTDTNLPKAAPIEGAFAWKLGQKAPAWVRFNDLVPTIHSFSYHTKTNAPFDYISIQCLNDRTIYMILATTPETTNIDDAQSTLDAVYQTLFAKYALPAVEKTNSYRWDSLHAPLRFVDTTLEGPRVFLSAAKMAYQRRLRGCGPHAAPASRAAPPRSGGHQASRQRPLNGSESVGPRKLVNESRAIGDFYFGRSSFAKALRRTGPPSPKRLWRGESAFAAELSGWVNPCLCLFLREAAQVVEGENARSVAVAPYRLNGIAAHCDQAVELE